MGVQGRDTRVRHATLDVAQGGPTPRMPGDRAHRLGEVSPPPSLPPAASPCGSSRRGQSMPCGLGHPLALCGALPARARQRLISPAGRDAASRAVRASPAVGCGCVPQPAGLAPPRLMGCAYLRPAGLAHLGRGTVCRMLGGCPQDLYASSPRCGSVGGVAPLLAVACLSAPFHNSCHGYQSWHSVNKRGNRKLTCFSFLKWST